jgi:predicted  nucleic acid-binding Zn-ribbon protein
MASTSIGRTNCPECGFDAAHVKRKDEEGKKAYRHCPDCGAQYFPRSSGQEKTLLEKVRPSKLDVAAEKKPEQPKADETVPTPAISKPVETPKRRGLFGS